MPERLHVSGTEAIRALEHLGFAVVRQRAAGTWNDVFGIEPRRLVEARSPAFL